MQVPQETSCRLTSPCTCAQVLTAWMPPEEEAGGGASWRRRTPAVAQSVLLLMDSHPLVLGHMVRSWPSPPPHSMASPFIRLSKALFLRLHRLWGCPRCCFKTCMVLQSAWL